MLDRSVAPPIGEIRDFNIPFPQHISLANGADFYYVSDPRHEVVKVEIHFWAGKWFEDTIGASTFFSKLFKEGTRTRSSSELNKVLESYGAFLDVAPGYDRVTINVYSLTKTLNDVLLLIVEMLTQFEIVESELSKLKEIQHSQLKINLEKTNFVSSRVFRNAIFGNSHPYGKVTNANDILDIESRTVQKHYLQNIEGASFTVIASGRIDSADIASIEQTLGSLPITKPLDAHFSNIESDFKPITEDREGAVQSTFTIGRFMPDRNSNDTHKIAITNEILGGYFGSRLMKNLREDKGYTYGIYSRINHLNHASYLSISADVIKKSREQAVDEVRKELSLLCERGIEESELGLVRNYMLGTLSSSVDSVFSIAQLFGVVHFSELDLNFFNERMEAIKSIDTQDVMEIARKYFQPNEMLKVIVG